MNAKARVIFRTGGGRQVGMGHLRRCLTLAEALRQMEIESHFLLDGDDMLRERVNAAGFGAFTISLENDLSETIEQLKNLRMQAVVIDSYALQRDYFRALSETGVLTIVIDDLADRELPVDVVINSSVGAECLPYRSRAHTQFLLGSKYSLLRPEFAEVPDRKIAKQARRVLITLGGSDPTGLTPKLMGWAHETIHDAALDVVIGPLYTDVARIENTAQDIAGAVALHFDPKHMRSLMLEADLAISAGGQTIYELAATGTPTIAVCTASNQTVNLMGFSDANALILSGSALDRDLEEKIKEAISHIADDAALRTTLSKRSRALVDGRGTERTARAIAERIEVLSP